MAAQYQVFQDSKGEWRWRFVANNGKIIAVSSESYKAREACEHGVELVKTEGAAAPVVVPEQKP